MNNNQNVCEKIESDPLYEDLRNLYSVTLLVVGDNLYAGTFQNLYSGIFTEPDEGLDTALTDILEILKIKRDYPATWIEYLNLIDFLIEESRARGDMPCQGVLEWMKEPDILRLVIHKEMQRRKSKF